MTPPADRRGSVPRSLLILLLVAVVTVGGLWWARQHRQVDWTLGGPLFPVPSDRIETIMLTRQGLQFRFDRQVDHGWTLSGAANDYLDGPAMTALVDLLPTVLGGAVLPGTVPDDRRYEFNGHDALRLRLFVAGGREISLDLGTLNPVTGNYFASGAGRPGCFPVAAPFRDKLFMLPITVQAKTLLPAFSRDKVQRLSLIRGDARHEFVRQGDQWWLRLPTADLAVALRGWPRRIRDYQAQYDDRRRQDAAGTWILASRQAVDQLIYEVSATVVRDIKSPREAAARLEQWALDPPWRQVILQGAGLNADPAAPVADQFTIAFGPPVSKDRVPALRRGNVLLTDPAAIGLIDQGLEVLVEQDAVAAWALDADRMSVTREGRRILAATRTGQAVTGEGRQAWETVVPAPDVGGLAEHIRQGFSRNLVVNLNRLEVLAVLPPTTDPTVLQDAGRVQITLDWDEGGQPHRLVLESGYLNESGVAAIGGVPDAVAAAGRPVGLWFPTSGKLLQISDQLIVTARNIAMVAPVATTP